MDENLQWKPHIEQLCRRLSKNLFLLSKLQPVISLEARKLFYFAHVQSHIDYASVVWDGCDDVHLKSLNSLHRRAAKLIVANSSLSTEDKLKSIGVLPLEQHLFYNKAIFMHKIQHDEAPSYLADMFQYTRSPYTCFKFNLSCSKPRIDIYKSSLSYAGAQVWNGLPRPLKVQCGLGSFKVNLHRYLFQRLST